MSSLTRVVSISLAIEGEVMTQEFYKKKYATGDFHYNLEYEREWLKKNLIDRFGLTPGDRILDLGCGKGTQAALLAEMGFRVFGLEITIEGVNGANARGSDAVFICDSAANLSKYFDNDYFDMIYCRGMSWFHRELHEVCELTGVNVSEKIPGFFQHIKPGGLFVLQISTNFSGVHPEGSVHNNRLSSFIDLFAPHGEVIHTSNWAGVEVASDEQAAEVKGNLVIATQKPV